jgi:hypothetical protein
LICCLGKLTIAIVALTTLSRCSHANHTVLLLLLNSTSGAKSSALECFWFLVMALEASIHHRELCIVVWSRAFKYDLSCGMLPRLHHPSGSCELVRRKENKACRYHRLTMALFFLAHPTSRWRKSIYSNFVLLHGKGPCNSTSMEDYLKISLTLCGIQIFDEQKIN